MSTTVVVLKHVTKPFAILSSDRISVPSPGTQAVLVTFSD